MEPAAVLLSAGPGATRAPALSAAASTLVAPLLDGPDRPLRLVGRTPAAVHLATGDDDLPLLAVTSAHAVRLPAGLQLAGTRPGDLPAGPVRVKGGRVLMGAVEVRVARWWAPPRPAVLDVDRALAAWCRLGPRLPCLEPVVAAALRAVGGRGPDLARAVPALVGLGTGLTPSGDDVLAGALVTLRAVARGGGARCGAYAGTLADAVAEAVADVLTGSSAGV
ncbi:MAG TPA: DUF2877 domain-containing protein, partial [Jiangellales bacterium]|nr:DUF2877 domain-containing protein [Jiangellales bacterium]